MVNYWVVKMQDEDALNMAQQYNFIAIGWDKLDDLEWILAMEENEAREELKDDMRRLCKLF